MVDLTALPAPEGGLPNGDAPTSLATAAARQLATTTKTPPQMQEISSRWLLRILPWVDVRGAVYRVNRRLVCQRGDGRVAFVTTGPDARVVPPTLRELAFLRTFADDTALRAIADRFEPRRYAPGALIVEPGQPPDQLVLVVHGKVEKVGTGKYGEDRVIEVLTGGDSFGYQPTGNGAGAGSYAVRALTATTVLTLSRQGFEEVLAQSDALRSHIRAWLVEPRPPQNRHGEAAIERASGHVGEPPLPRTFVAYDVAPREYELSVSQTILRVHTRVGDLYSDPMDQVEEQLRLTVEALREEQEHQLVNNSDFGLLHNADLTQRISTRTGPVTPDDMDELLTRRRKTRCYLAHSKAIAAFHRECNRQGIYPGTVEVMGRTVPSWRGVPLLSCNKIPISDAGSTSILAFRIGEQDEGVIGLYQTGIPDEREPGLSVRRMGADDRAVTNYLVSCYYSAAVLVPSALGILENVELGR